ncbi:MAG TPA: methyltransferase domain-containing protein [Chitinophagaceae bacterium]|nr:methyltransferase domain-containing protein [Chitinophagaceae bacterium]
MFQKIVNKVKRKLRIPIRYPSETSKVRSLVIEFCKGYGCDIGFGGDKIKEDAVGIDFTNPYANTGGDKVDIGCDVIKDEIPVPDNTYDYVYSSHLIEDFEDTGAGLRKFIKVLKHSGLLILVFPDQRVYEEHCRKSGQALNLYHKHADMGLTFMLDKLKALQEISFEILFSSNCAIDYNVIIIAKILKHGANQAV